MILKVIWTSRDGAEAVAALPVQGPLPCRTVLVPRRRAAHALQRELVQTGHGDALAGTRFVVAPAAAVELLRAAGTAFETGEEDFRAARLQVLFRSDLRLAHFSLDLLRSKSGWNNAFARTISDLEGAGLRPADLEAAASARLRDVATIWRALDESAGRSWTIQRVYAEATAVLNGRPEFWRFQGAVLTFAASDITVTQARFFHAIPNATLGILIARPLRAHYLERMKALLGDDAADIAGSTTAPRSDERERDILASYFFEPPTILADGMRPRSSGPDGTVALEQHAGVEDEIEATADWVARQVSVGTPLENIAVLVPTLDPFAGLIADRLRRLPWHDGVLPVHVAGGLPLAEFTAGARALATVRAIRTHLAAESLAPVIPALRTSSPNERHLSHGAATNLVWSLGTVGGNPARQRGALEWAERAATRESELSERLASAAAQPEDSGISKEARQSEKLLAGLRAIRPALDALVGVARLVLDDANLARLWPILCAFLRDWLLQPTDGPRADILLAERLDRMASDRACGSLAGEDALRLIEETIFSTRVPVGTFGEPAVYVGTIRDAVGLRFDSVRVIGLAEGHFPSVAREDPVVPDVLRRSIRTKGISGEVSPPTAMEYALEDLHALDTILRNTESCIGLSTPRVDIERSQREPSSVILEAAAALGRPNRSTGERGATIPDVVALQRDAFAPAREVAAKFRRERPLGEAAWQDAVSFGALRSPARWQGIRSLDLDRVATLTMPSDPGPLDGVLGVAGASLQVRGLTSSHPISPSALEKLLRCPHEFLLGNILHFDEAASPPPQREIGQPSYGNLFHSIAAEFYGANGGHFCAREGTLADWLILADQIVERHFSAFLKQYPLVGDAVRAQQRNRLRRDVREFIEYDWAAAAGLRFVAAERAFGQPVPVELPVSKRSLFLSGRIDRIDVDGLRSIVRDIKTGQAHLRIGKDAAPDPLRDLQIAIYGLVTRSLATEWGLPARIGVAYAYVGRSGAVERGYRDDFHELLEPAARRWLDVAAGLLAERLFPRTPNASDCSYCCFRPVCGNTAHERATAVLAANESLLADFTRLKTAAVEEH